MILKDTKDTFHNLYKILMYALWQKQQLKELLIW